ncbi:MAG: FkbM family methyltransferase [Chloroflexi bacterium]|nr:FkbM family methyltransferase [Chloroflexota bacterium]
MSKKPSILESLFLALPLLSQHHAHGSAIYDLLKQVARQAVESLFYEVEPKTREFPPFGELILPYHKMGAIDSLNLFDLDELIIFSFYWANRQRYRHVLDIGANIGLHSIILSKCGYEVRAYEPDPNHFEIMQRNLVLNDCAAVQAFNAAVSSQAGKMEFVRVLGNTTASHLAGAKPNPYGDLERFPVKVEAIKPLIAWADLIKLDAEGHEKEIILATKGEQWQNTDALVEIENANNAAAVHQHLTSLGVNLFAQKTNWQLVRDVNGMPTSYHEGTLFVTCKGETPWYE